MATDTVNELANGGVDRVVSSVSYVLTTRTEVKRIETTNLHGIGAINLAGNEFQNTIVGNDGTNILDGAPETTL